MTKSSWAVKTLATIGGVVVADKVLQACSMVADAYISPDGTFNGRRWQAYVEERDQQPRQQNSFQSTSHQRQENDPGNGFGR